MLKRQIRAEHGEYLRAGVIASAVANYGFKERRHPLEPHQVFTCLPEPDPEVMDEDEACAIFAMMEEESKKLTKN